MSDEKKYELKIDSEKQTIQGVHIDNSEKFKAIRFVVESNYADGWRPSKEDVEHLRNYYDNPLSETQNDK